MRFIKSNTGFVLVELIIVTVILGAVFPLSIFFIDSMKAAQETKIQQSANYLAQKFMEEYKAKDLATITATTEPIKTVINGKNLYTSVAVEHFLEPVEATNYIGKVEITSSAVGLKTIRINDTSFDDSWEEYILRLTENRLYLSAKTPENEYNLGSVAINLPVEDPELNIFVSNDPYMILNVKNELADKKLIINKIETVVEGNPNFSLPILEGKVAIRDSELIEGYERGYNLIITVKNEDNVELAKLAQTRMINWSLSQK